MALLLEKIIITICILLPTIVNARYMNQKEFYDNFRHIRPLTSVQIQQQAAEDVISRLIPDKAHLFKVEIDFSLKENTFHLEKNRTTSFLLIRASNGVSACKGFYYYIKYNWKGHISWSGNHLDSIPTNLTGIEIHYTSTSDNRFIYYENVCTWSYSFAWWTWKDWRKHIDWMALMGISLTIAPIQEAIYTRVYKRLGLTDTEINDHFAGPAFQAWQRMGNIRGWGGPLPATYKDAQLDLQKKIIEEQRNLGMAVAIPGFGGYVPLAFKRLFPNASMEIAKQWNNFPNELCCPLFVDPNDPLFFTLGKQLLNEVIKEYGTDHIYFADPFNEMEPPQNSPAYLSKTAENIYNSMFAVDSGAVWLLQGWMFVKNPFWTEKLMKSFLTAVPQGKMLVLDLQSELFPQYERTKFYYGQPFIWCMLHNFGGTLGMHGSLDIVNFRINATRHMQNNTMIGVGITPEGINQNYVMYEFALENGWESESIVTNNWIRNYYTARYGGDNEKIRLAWIKLRFSVYAYHGLEKLHGKYTICRRPNIKLKPWTWYHHSILDHAFSDMLDSAVNYGNSNELFNHDLVDVGRQFLQNKFDQLYINLMVAYKNKDKTTLDKYTEMMTDLILDADRLLMTNRYFLLGNWLESAKILGNHSQLEQFVFEVNARNQITTWGPDGQIVDYATKQWSGMFSDYFLPRWSLFFDELKRSLSNAVPFDSNNFKWKIFETVENPFNVDTKIYPTTADGDSVEIAKEIYQKWSQNNSAITMKEVPFRDRQHFLKKISFN